MGFRFEFKTLELLPACNIYNYQYRYVCFSYIKFCVRDVCCDFVKISKKLLLHKPDIFIIFLFCCAKVRMSTLDIKIFWISALLFCFYVINLSVPTWFVSDCIVSLLVNFGITYQSSISKFLNIYSIYHVNLILSDWNKS